MRREQNSLAWSCNEVWCFYALQSWLQFFVHAVGLTADRCALLCSPARAVQGCSLKDSVENFGLDLNSWEIHTQNRVACLAVVHDINFADCRLQTLNWMTHKKTLSLQWPCTGAAITPLCAKLLFVVNTLTVLLSFCYIECELFAVFIKILFDNWRRFCRPSVIYVPVKCPRGGGIWLPEWTLVWGIWTAFWPGY